MLSVLKIKMTAKPLRTSRGAPRPVGTDITRHSLWLSRLGNRGDFLMIFIVGRFERAGGRYGR
ncbi:MAG: hypothetical protein J2P17_18290, partial [Mycobacterium sp.]|nr:hypothetical protein [Mycobacterium sp.]